MSKFSVHTPDNVYVLQEEWLKRPDIVFDDQTSVFVGNNVGMLVMVSSYAFKNSYTGMYRESMEGDARTHTKGNYYRAVFSTVRHISAFFSEISESSIVDTCSSDFPVYHVCVSYIVPNGECDYTVHTACI